MEFICEERLERENDGEFKMDEAIRELIFMSEVESGCKLESLKI